MSEITEKAEGYISSEVGQAIKTLLAYSYKKSSTTIDDEIVENASDIAELLAKELESLEDEDPTVKEAKTAALTVFEFIANKTGNKWDNAAVKVLKLLM